MRKTLAIIMMIAMVFCYMPLTGFADTEVIQTTQSTSNFKDMPNNWSTDALSKAVGNGLLEGFKEKSGTFIKPKDPLTRAQMATIVNRAFGANSTASLTGVKDVPQKAWYTAEMQKAVKMGTMKLDSKMRPNDPITRQEAFTVLARAFKMTDGTKNNLEKFSDGDKVSSWAISPLGALAREGYIQGSNGKLNPQSKITRAEFAVVMDNMIKEYINKAGTVTQVHEGNLMINVPDVILQGITVKGDLILGDGIGEGNITLENVIVKGNLIARGGGVNSIVINGGSIEGKVVIAKVDGQIRVFVNGAQVEMVVIDDGKDDIIVEGTVGTLEITAPDVPVVLNNATVNTITVNTEGSANLQVGAGSTVTNVVVSGNSSGTNLKVDGKVTNVETSAPGTNVQGTGQVSNVTAKEGANNTKVETPNTSISNQGAEGVTAGGGTSVPSGTTSTNSSDGTGSTVTPPSTGGGGSGSSTPVVNKDTEEVVAAKAAIKPNWEISSIKTAKDVVYPEALPEGVGDAEYKVTIGTTYADKAAAQGSGRSVTTLFTIPANVTVWYPVWADSKLTYESATGGEVAFGMVGHPLSAGNIDADGVIYVARGAGSGTEFTFSIKLVDSEWDGVVYGEGEFTKELSEYGFILDNTEVEQGVKVLLDEDSKSGEDGVDIAGMTPINVNIEATTVNTLGYGNVVKIMDTEVSGPSGSTMEIWAYSPRDTKWFNIVKKGWGPLDLAYDKEAYATPYDAPVPVYIFADTEGEYTVTFKAVDTATGKDVATETVTITVGLDVLLGTWETSGNPGVHEDKLYTGFELKYEGEKVSLSSENIVAIIEERPDGTKDSLTLNSDTILWFNVATKPAGTYVYKVKAKSGETYIADLTWPEFTITPAVKQSEDLVLCGDGIYRYHYKINIAMKVSDTFVFRQKPNGEVDEQTINDDSDDFSIYFRPTGGIFTQVIGDHTYFIKKGDTWYKSVIHYEESPT